MYCNNFRKTCLQDFKGPTALKDVKLYFYQAKSKTTTLLIQCNWSDPWPLCSWLISLKSTVMLTTVLDTLIAA